MSISAASAMLYNCARHSEERWAVFCLGSCREGEGGERARREDEEKIEAVVMPEVVPYFVNRGKSG